jgi:hypothetical protein
MNNKITIEVDQFGTKFWKLNGDFHREDGPAVEYDNGDKEWWFNGEFHREDGPAVEYFNGEKEWWVNGKLHRVDGPAIINNDGSVDWFLNGLRYYFPENWFKALTPEQQYNYLWNLDE